MVICLERVADLHTAQLIPLPLTDSCFSKIQIGFTFLVPTHPGSPGKGPLNGLLLLLLRLSCSVSHLTQKQRDDKYDLNQLRTGPWIPNQDERRVIKMSWSIVSKAAERSSRQIRDTFCDPIAPTRSSWRLRHHPYDADAKMPRIQYAEQCIVNFAGTGEGGRGKRKCYGCIKQSVGCSQHC